MTSSCDIDFNCLCIWVTHLLFITQEQPLYVCTVVYVRMSVCVCVSVGVCV